MRFKFAVKAIASLLLAGFTTASVSLYYSQKLLTTLEERSLILSRQITEQAEGIAFALKQGDFDESSQSEPLSWAARLLNQGSPERSFRVFRIDRAASAPEARKLDLKNNIFTYEKTIFPENQAGIRVEIQVGYEGLFGAKSRSSNDLYVLIVFSTLFLLAFSLSSLIFRSTEKSKAMRLLENDVNDFKDGIESGERGLVDLGRGVRNILKNAKEFAVSTQKSRDELLILKQNFQKGLNQIHSSYQLLRTKEDLVTKLEEEFSVLDGKETSGRVNELIQLMKQSRRILEQAERDVEPLSTNVDVSFSSLDKALKGLRQFDKEIDMTSKTLKKQFDTFAKVKQDSGQFINQKPNKAA